MNKAMTVPPSSEFNLQTIFEYLIGGGTLMGLYWQYIEYKFKMAKILAERERAEREEFIDKVVRTSMTAVLKEFKADFDEFKSETKATMKEFNGTVLKIYSEVKK